jgi:hypothetical protein
MPFLFPSFGKSLTKNLNRICVLDSLPAPLFGQSLTKNLNRIRLLNALSVPFIWQKFNQELEQNLCPRFPSCSFTWPKSNQKLEQTSRRPLSSHRGSSLSSPRCSSPSSPLYFASLLLTLSFLMRRRVGDNIVRLVGSSLPPSSCAAAAYPCPCRGRWQEHWGD